MTDKRRIQPGESMLEIAYEGGFDSWMTVWNDEANAELRELRKDPQVLLPGDEVAVPQRETTPKESCPVDKLHRFRLVRPRAWVNLRMLDEDGEPISGARYRLTINGEAHDGNTDADGMLSVEIGPDVHRGVLKVWPAEDTPPFEAPIRVGHLDPAAAPSGLRARLVNLGIDLAEHDDHGPAGAHLWHRLASFASFATTSTTPRELATALEEEHDKWQRT